MKNKGRKIIIFLFSWLIASTAFLTLLVWSDPLKRSAIGMVWCLILFWVIICGSVIYSLREKFAKFFSKLRWPFWLTFTVFSTIFALIEEAIAVSINNFFLPYTHGAVQLTASTNYLEVVSKHSVVVLIPIFFVFSLLIKKFNWGPFKSFIIFGIIGTLAEATISGVFALLSFGLWIFVYGLMIYLPSHALKN